MKILIRTVLVACALFAVSGVSRAQTEAPARTTTVPADKVIPQNDLMTPADLQRQLSHGEKPLMLQVGSHVLYAQAHIPGSEYVGAAGSEEGLQALGERVKTLRKDQSLVIYCGCCPWDRCPNIRAAYKELHALGFTHVKALYIANNFGTDWVDQGYPVEKGR